MRFTSEPLACRSFHSVDLSSDRSSSDPLASLLLASGVAGGISLAACAKHEPKPPAPVQAGRSTGSSAGGQAPAASTPSASAAAAPGNDGGRAGTGGAGAGGAGATAAAPAAGAPHGGTAGAGGAAARPASLAELGPISGPKDDATTMTIAGIRAPKPAEWTWQPPTMEFRNLQYAVPAPDGKGEPAELIVSVFLGNDGGPLDANVNRWASQFRTDDGKAATPVRSEIEVNGLKVHLIELKGKYQGMSAPMAKPGTTQLGAIVETPRARVFVRLVGPEATVEANRAAWDRFVKGMAPVAAGG
ncbi:MAG: hypothetical protein U0575_13995 [Phycisphaerales bacterium]